MHLEIEKISNEINVLITAVDNLRQLGKDLPALDRNLQRISASIKMLELNFVDPQRYLKSCQP